MGGQKLDAEPGTRTFLVWMHKTPCFAGTKEGYPAEINKLIPKLLKDF